MIRVALIEDEPLAAEFLASLLTKTGKVVVVGTARDASWGLTMCADQCPDAVFLDIRLPGPDGVELAAQLGKLQRPPLIVFTTAHGDRACDAFRLMAVDYLLKPLDPAQVWEAVCRLEARLAQPDAPKSSTPIVPAEGRLPVKCGRDDVVMLIPRWEIVAAIRHHRRTWIHTATDEFPTYYAICEILAWLGDPGFLRISRDTIVNLQSVEEVVHYGDRLFQIKLRDRAGTLVDASRSGAGRLASLIKPSL